MKRVLGGYQGAHADFEDDLESEDVSYVSIQNNIANSGPAAVTERESDTDVLLDYCCQLDVETNAKALKINEKVADVVNKLCVKRVSQGQSKEIMKRHNIPENVMVRLPKCEQSIWNQLPARTRVNAIKPQFKAGFAKGLCTSTIPGKKVSVWG